MKFLLFLLKILNFNKIKKKQRMDIPKEILIEILEYFSVQELIKLELVNKQFLKIIRSNEWPNLTIKFSKINLKLIKNHSFINFDLSASNITDKQLRYLSNSKNLNLLFCKITDKGLKYLNSKNLNLSFCKITDKGLKYLSNSKNLNLSYTEITDKGLQYLSNS